MWHSEADIFKDLMSLDDYGKDETYKVLYSRGRGFKNLKKPEPTNSFVDSRTGETINLEEILEPSEICYKSRGRGNALGSFLRSRNQQLEKQLRLARPLGSGDNVVEAFYRRNIPAKNEESISESEAGQPGTSTNVINSPFGLLINNVKQRVKATRNSKLQQNALINSLISKGICESDWSSGGMKLNLGSGDVGGDNDDDDDDDDDDNSDGKGDCSITSLSKSYDIKCNKSRESNIQTSGSDINMKIDNMNTQERDVKVVDNFRKTQEKKHTPRISANFFSPNKKTSALDKKCQCLGEKFNKEGEHLWGSTSKNFTANSKDFPPLRNSTFS